MPLKNQTISFLLTPPPVQANMPPKAVSAPAVTTSSPASVWKSLALLFGVVVVAVAISLAVKSPSDGRSRPGATPETMSTFLSWARNEANTGIMIHPNVAVVNGGKKGPWTWTLVAYNSSAREVPPLTETLAEFQAAAVVANRGKPHHVQVAISKGEVVAYVPQARAISGDNTTHLHKVLAERMAAAGGATDPFVGLLSQSHYSLPLHLSATEAARCLGPVLFREYNRSFSAAHMGTPPVKVHIAAAMTRMFNGDLGTKAMIPVLDLANHRTRGANAVIEMNDAVQPAGSKEVPFFRLSATRDIINGEEIAWTYHPDMPPYHAVSNYGFLDVNDLPNSFPLLGPAVPQNKFTQKAGCSTARDSFMFEWDSGKVLPTSLNCADAVFSENPEEELGGTAFPEGTDALTAAKRQMEKQHKVRVRSLKKLLRVAVEQMESFPARFDNASAIPTSWKRGKDVSASFIATKKWQECVDGGDDAVSSSSSANNKGNDVRQEIFEASFAADAVTRAALQRAASWMRRELQRKQDL